jgi:hypothetical protein
MPALRKQRGAVGGGWGRDQQVTAARVAVNRDTTSAR